VGEQAPVSRPEVEDTTSVARHVLEQNALALGAMRKRIRTGEIVQRAL
jgi:hypothetical protein